MHEGQGLARVQYSELLNLIYLLRNVGGGGTGGGIISVATEADLASEPAVSIPRGSLAFVQANGGEYWSWYPTGYLPPAGTVSTVPGHGGEWAFIEYATASIPATIIGGATYTAEPTDTIFDMDSSNGAQPAVNLWPTPKVDQEFTAIWVAGINVLPKINGNGNQITDYESGNQVTGASTVINTPGGFGTWKYNGALWRQVG